MKAVIYARYSSHNQQEQSIDGQLRACNDFAVANKLEIVDTYIDRARSGRNSKRPAFQKMLSDAILHKFQVVLVYQYDRFARNRYEALANEIHLQKNGVKLISATENINDEDSSSVIVKGMFEAIAEYYSVDLSKKVRRGLKESVIARKSLGGIRLLGYKTNADKKIIVDEAEAVIVKRIFKMRLDNATVQEIADKLNSENLLNKTVPFNRLSIRKILENRKYLGEYRNPYDKTEIIFDMFPRIIDDKTFEDVQKTFEPMKIRSSSRRKEQGRVFYLTEKLFSAVDGTPFFGSTGTSATGKKYSYYKAKVNGYYVNYRQDKLENRIIETLKSILSTNAFLDYISEKITEAYSLTVNNDEIEDLKSAQDKLKRKIIKVSEAFIDANAEMRQALNEEMTRLRSQLSTVEGQIEDASRKNSAPDSKIIKSWFKKFLDRDLNVPENRSKFFKIVLNSAFIFDKHIDLYINFDVADTVTFEKYKKDLSMMDKPEVREIVRVNVPLAVFENIRANFFIENHTIFLSFSL